MHPVLEQNPCLGKLQLDSEVNTSKMKEMMPGEENMSVDSSDSEDQKYVFREVIIQVLMLRVVTQDYEKKARNLSSLNPEKCRRSRTKFYLIVWQLVFKLLRKSIILKGGVKVAKLMKSSLKSNAGKVPSKSQVKDETNDMKSAAGQTAS